MSELFVMFNENELGEIHKSLPESSELKGKIEECLRTRQTIRLVEEMNLDNIRDEV